MKLLLTSNGLSNQTIAKALIELVGKPASETVVVFIPTAMNVTRGNKDWFINDLNNIQTQGFKAIDIVDISALTKEVWLPRMEKADVLFFSGGNTSHLMNWLKQSGLAEMIPEMLKTKVWAGISAGSMVTNPSLALSSADKKIYYEEISGYKSEEALHLVDFYIRPHYNSAHYPDVNEANLREVMKEFHDPLYAIDDNSAVKVDGDKIEVVTEGQYLKL
jgi:dipeptidase E